ncbi:hypothetical protein [Enterococcus mundtii]|uniref:hypothetical protein n=1 Tax=Enterococcus mundtii TaxID=53346 RepID=UPI000BB54A47|nr:hypothetical protein [Enterococcus mundtii]PJK25532.1 hypothetical protein CV769_09545 [Enterococcus mundtii]GKS55282.1 hypothetical protein EMLAB_18970 [Enterococcus mundtii]
MAGNVDGYQFDNIKISAENDAKMYHALARKRSYVISGYEQGLELSSSGLDVRVASGSAIIQGRMVYVKEAQSITLPANSSGYVCLTIDLNESVIPTDDFPADSENYSWTNNQVRLEAVNHLINGNTLAGDRVVTFPLCSYTTSGTTAIITKNTINYNDSLIESLPLWTGILTMNTSHIIRLSKKFEDLNSGLLLIWAPYANGSAWNYDFTTQFLPKRAGLHVSQVLNSSSNWINKRIQVDYSSNSIWGHGGNVSSEGLKAVLREIREV